MAVIEWPRSTTVTEIRSFLGFVNYKRIIPNLSRIAKPVHQLPQNLEGTSNKRKNLMYPGYQNKRKPLRLTELCTHFPSLAYANFKATFILHADVSGEGLGAVLYQVQNGKRRVIAYASRIPSKSEKNYSFHKLEY